MDIGLTQSDTACMPPPPLPAAATALTHAPVTPAAATHPVTGPQGVGANAQVPNSQNSTHKPQRKQKQKQQKQHRHQLQQTNANGNNKSNAGGARPRKLKQPRTHEMPRMLAEILHEPKQALLHRVVRAIGPKAAWDLLKETLRVEAQGGQRVNADASGTPAKFLETDTETQAPAPRKRTTGGIYFALLKDAVPRETYKEIYAVESKRKHDFKKRVRYQRKQIFEGELAQLGFDVLGLAGSGTGQGDVTADGGGVEHEEGECDEHMELA